MRTSLNWIKDLVPGLSCTPKEYTDAMTLSGSKVEFFEEFDRDLDKIVVGQVDSIEKHPDADKLVICQVNIGTEKVQIVTGAPNVFEGAKVPVVLSGGRVAGGHDGEKVEGGIKISKGKLRGVPSYGMMCSIEELGSDRNFFPDAPEYGLYILPEDTEIGADVPELLGLRDAAIEYEITSNRVDCYSVLGLAREAAATFGLKFVPPVVPETGNSEDVNDLVKVTVKDSDLCRRYTARAIKNVHIAPSPKWMQNRLRSQGIRPINNLVDITNYVMVEYGQPMHAYDLSTIEGSEIIVDVAKDGEKFTTLDGEERELDSKTIMINDAKKHIGIAGIMGGENSMITGDVDTVLFESACFDGTSIRLSSKKIGLRTDASGIFEKGLDPNNAILAINRACALVEELGCGEVVGGVVDVYGKPMEDRRLPFEPERYNRMLGTDIDKETQLSYLKAIDLGYDEKSNELLIPSWRQDLLSYADIAEEVARFYGYDKIPTTLPSGEATAGKLGYKGSIDKLCRETVEFCGFSQAMTYSFESKKVYDKLLIPEGDKLRDAIEISNPLGEDYSIMRTVSLNGMLTSLATNYNRRNPEAFLYEIGNVYLAKSLPLTELPDERKQLTLGFYGEGDFYNMKGCVEELLSKVGMDDKLTYDPASKKPYLHPGRQANIIYDGEVIGFIGEVHPMVLKNYKIGTKVYIADIDMPHIYEKANFDKKFVGINNFPASTRDLALVVPKDVLAQSIEKIFDKDGGEYMEDYSLFDLYEGNQIKEGFKSMAYSLKFRAKDRNLADNDVNAAIDSIIEGLKSIGVELRK
ncbi:MAG: phenylalanine--tRNA ligase subunit beta [Lachnospiraceae bacterium]|nr:phenylalanine--tRNA ligase subunit beta [Lachnospiraceae bacterium]